MTLVVVIAAMALFFVALERSGLVGLSYRVVAESNAALKIVGARDLDDDAKEAAARRLAVDMLRLFVAMAVRVAAVLLAPAAVLSLAVFAGATDFDSIWRASVSWPLILANLALFAVVFVRRRHA